MPKFAVACLIHDGHCIRIDAATLKQAHAICGKIHDSYKPTVIEQHSKLTKELLTQLSIPKIEMKMIATYKVQEVSRLVKLVHKLMRKAPKPGTWSVATEKAR